LVAKEKDATKCASIAHGLWGRYMPCGGRYMTRLIVFILTLLISFSALPCSGGPKSGFGFTTDELIKNADLIVLAQVADIESVQSASLYRFEVLKTLKGRVTEEIKFFGFGKDYHDNHFQEHADDMFWVEQQGRSEFPCCLCGPDHTFIKGENYLLFPSHFGAFKSAEIIKNKNDKWLQYVLKSM